LQAPSIDEKVDLHFIALVNVGGHLYELGKNTFYLSLHLFEANISSNVVNYQSLRGITLCNVDLGSFQLHHRV